MKVFFLTPWFPNRIHPRHGNFVEQHARVVARRHELVVVTVQPDAALPVGRYELREDNGGGYHCVRCYFGQREGEGSWKRLFARYRAYAKVLGTAEGRFGRPDLLHGHVLVDGGIAAAWFATRWGIPYLISAHSTRLLWPNALGGIRWLLARRACRSAAKILPVSERLRRGMEAKNGLTGKYEVVSNVVNTELFQPPSSRRLSDKTLRLLHVSDFKEEHKNIGGLLEGFKKARARSAGAMVLHVAGDGDFASLHRRIAAAGLSDVVTTSGPHPEAEIANLMRRHHALVHFSHYETQGVVVLEAQCTGLPALVADNTALPETIVDGVTGLLIRSGDTDDLADKLCYLRDNYSAFDQDQITALAREKHGIEAIGRQLDALYRSAVR